MLTAYIAVLLASRVQVQDPEVQKLFDWYESMKLEQYLAKPFVSIQNSSWDQRADHGFLLEETPHSVKVLTTSLAFIELKKDNDSKDRPSTKPANLKSVLASSVEFSMSDEEFDKRYKRVHTSAPLVTVAWLCAKNGLPAQSKKLIEFERKRFSEINEHLKLDYVARAKSDAMDPILHQAMLDFENEALEWSDLLTRFEAFEARYRDHPAQGDITKILKAIRTNIEEKKTHVPKSTTEQEKIEELIWSLPYQKARNSWVANTEAGRALLAKDFAAAPALIAAIGDERLTRLPWIQMSGPPMSKSYRTIYQVGECAVDLLECIANRQFEGTSSKEIQQEALMWYESVKKRGEKSVLAEKARKGSHEGLESAKALAEKYPKDAFEAIREGYNKTNDDYRRYFIETLSKANGKEVDDFVLQVAKKDKNFGARVAALSILFERDRGRANALAIAEWNAFKRNDYGFELNTLVGLLHDAYHIRSIKALGKGLRKKPVDVRQIVLTSWDSSWNKPTYPKTAPPYEEVRNALEDLYASELDDSERWPGGMSSGSYNLSTPKLSTLAVIALGYLQPGIYSFQDSTNEKDYEAQRLEAIKIYKSRRAK